jgi:histidinol-phosphatase (PHP family)
MAALLEARDWDYVIGSIHFLQDAAIDMRGDWDIWRSGDPDKVWRRYFETLGEAARSGLFDVLGHPDLVKLWGQGAPVPDRDLRFYYELAMEGIAESDVAIEVSTAGLRKPVGEIYPARPFLEMCLEVGRPVALSSDAHVPDDLAYRYEEALEYLDALGIDEIAVFEGRVRRLEPVG